MDTPRHTADLGHNSVMYRKLRKQRRRRQKNDVKTLEETIRETTKALSKTLDTSYFFGDGQNGPLSARLR